MHMHKAKNSKENERERGNHMYVLHTGPDTTFLEPDAFSDKQYCKKKFNWRGDDCSL